MEVANNRPACLAGQDLALSLAEIRRRKSSKSLAAGLEQSAERAARNARLAEIGQAMVGIAHESRNALQRLEIAIVGLRKQTSDPGTRKLVADVEQASDTLLRLFEDIRHFSASMPLRLRFCNLGLVWHNAWSHLGPSWRGRDVELRQSVEQANVICKADAARLEQVFCNLFENALAACPDPVVIEIRCKTSQIGDVPAISIHISDNGPGILPEHANRIFEPFFTTKASGTGLGMAITKRIVEAHGGTIQVARTHCRGGAEFVITLPIRAKGPETVLEGLSSVCAVTPTSIRQ